MPWSGSGVFTRVYSWVADKAAGINITASRMDTDTNDITANGLGNCLTRDGQGGPSANLPMGGYKHTGAAASSGSGEYVTYEQVTGATLALAGTALHVSGAAATVRPIQFQTATVGRWQLDVNATAESGTNAGSDLELWSYTDAGAQLTKLLAVTRSTGAAIYAGAWTFSASGTALTVTNNASIGGTLAVTGAATFNAAGTFAGAGSFNAAGTGLAVAHNASVGGTLAVTGTATAANGTSGLQVVNFSQFVPSLGGVGYTRLPGGLTIQWGSAVTDGSGNATVTFGTAFSSSVYSFVTQSITPGSTLGALIVSGTGAASVSIISVNTSSGAPIASITFFWMATGPT